MIKQLLSLMMMLASFNLLAQNDAGYKKGEDGIEYKIITDGKNDFIKDGEFLEMHFHSILFGIGKDSVLASTRQTGTSQIIPFDSTSIPPVYYKIFAQMRKGDSVSTKTMVDSLFKTQPDGSMPTFMDKGDFVYTNIKIINIYKTKEEAEKVLQENTAKQEAITKEKEAAQLNIDDKILSEYIADNKITATKSPKGTYVQITKPGIGVKLDNTKFVKVKYKGKTLNGNIFDTNMDNSKGHTEPLLVNLTNDLSLGNGVIPGMADALLMMQKGTKAVIYIPSTLAYGSRGAGGEIPPNANLIFEVEVLSILNKAQVVAANAIEERKMRALQKKYVDSLQKADPKAAAELRKQMIEESASVNEVSGVTIEPGKINNTRRPTKKPKTSKTPIKSSAIKKTAKKK
jgi:FKBP-type peptidyl-prolyl cis-trans isomerase FkpA